ncbi:MAG: hypothetical protein IKK58_01725 [Clostridia bacterium]|nr:hypothetical protein [Clostridia bacterium]
MELDTTTRDILLLDIYGGLLTERQRNLLTLHLEDDLSLGEIASLEGISRQGVRDCIVKGTAVMLKADSQLGLLKKELRLRALLKDMLASGEQSFSQRLKDILERSDSSED